MVIFGYDFPHYKTEKGIRELLSYKHHISLVILQEYKKLNIPFSNNRVYVKQNPTGNIKQICKTNGIKYIVADHDSEYTISVLKKLDPQIGIIFGARILKKSTIDCFKKGIINLHPGDIPLNRGLDNFKWAIIKLLPMTVTAHFINEKIDLGKIITKSSIDIFQDDTIFDFSNRHFYNEFTTMHYTFELLQNNMILNDINEDGNYFSAVPNELDKNINYYFDRYKERFAK